MQAAHVITMACAGYLLFSEPQRTSVASTSIAIAILNCTFEAKVKSTVATLVEMNLEVVIL